MAVWASDSLVSCLGVWVVVGAIVVGILGGGVPPCNLVEGWLCLAVVAAWPLMQLSPWHPPDPTQSVI